MNFKFLLKKIEMQLVPQKEEVHVGIVQSALCKACPGLKTHTALDTQLH